MGVVHPILAPRKKPVYTEEDVKAPRDRKLGHCGGPRKKPVAVRAEFLQTLGSPDGQVVS